MHSARIDCVYIYTYIIIIIKEDVRNLRVGSWEESERKEE